MGTTRKNKPKVIVVLGPTASGKSELAVCLAQKFDGEVISADSRQVYKGMDIGSGKITEKEKDGVHHHLLDVVSPKNKFSVSKYKELAEEKIEKILKLKKVPIVAGGTAFYLKVLIDGLAIPKVSPNWKLRKNLEKRNTNELYDLLTKLDPQRAKNIQKENKRRLIRAIEIIKSTGKKVPPLKKDQKYTPLFLGIEIPQDELYKRIEKRLFKRIEQGMIEEVEELKKSGVSWKRLESFGLEYEWVAKYLQGKVKYENMIENILTSSKRFSKKQKTWWKYDDRIKWIRDHKEAEKITKEFLK